MHQFSLTASDDKPSEWSLKHLPGHGRIRLTAHLLAEGSNAASATFYFGYVEKGMPQVRLQVGDDSCSGVYRMRVFHKESAKSELVDYFRTGVRWEDPLEIEVEWWADGRFSLKLGSGEVKTFKLQERVKDFVLMLYCGGINVDSLVYTDLEE